MKVFREIVLLIIMTINIAIFLFQDYIILWIHALYVITYIQVPAAALCGSVTIRTDSSLRCRDSHAFSKLCENNDFYVSSRRVTRLI